MPQPRGRKRPSSSAINKKTHPPGKDKGKSATIQTSLYNKLLAFVHIYIEEHEDGPTDSCKELCETLLSQEQSVAENSLFADEIFKSTCRRLARRNEAMVVLDILPLIVPRAEILYAYGAKDLEHLVEELNHSWYGCVPIAPGPVPQPDYCVGFKDSAFTPDQLTKLAPYIKGWKRTPFVVTGWMHFPFLVVEAKRRNASLNAADRQNAHSASVAVQQVLSLFQKVSREQELHRKILVFSISHDAFSVRIYGHYARIEKDQISFHRHEIQSCCFVTNNGRDKWVSHKFVKNVYQTFVPSHLERIRSAVSQLPNPSSQPEPGVAGPSATAPTSLPEEVENLSTLSDMQNEQPSTPSSPPSPSVFKKPRRSNRGK